MSRLYDEIYKQGREDMCDEIKEQLNEMVEFWRTKSRLKRMAPYYVDAYLSVLRNIETIKEKIV
jgi:hypothetical protein